MTYIDDDDIRIKRVYKLVAIKGGTCIFECEDTGDIRKIKVSPKVRSKIKIGDRIALWETV